ncbi:hypothetical protein HZB01_03975 [Candidatus Woesearchaeota archaeon]|nr:hypothetical protein [Candidatus Woesearchaeota archaeon]
MVTTISVTPQTLDILRQVKEEKQAKNFDDVIRMLVQNMKKPVKSYRGFAKHTPAFVREELDRFA